MKVLIWVLSLTDYWFSLLFLFACIQIGGWLYDIGYPRCPILIVLFFCMIISIILGNNALNRWLGGEN